MMQEPMRTMNRVTQAVVMIFAVAALAVVSYGAHAATTIVYVDDSAVPGGDGSEASPVQTVQEGIALLGKNGGVVAIHPGTYIGPILVDRDDVVLWGLADPVYDADGYLSGFTSDDEYDEEVVISIDRFLEDEDLSIGKQPEDLIELRGSHNEVHNIVIDMSGYPMPGDVNLSYAISAKAEDDEFYDNIVFSHILIRGSVLNLAWSSKANVLFEYITSLAPGFNGIYAAGNGHVEMHNLHFARKAVAILCNSIWEYPKEENGPSHLTGVVQNCRLRNGIGWLGYFPGTGLAVVGRASRVNPAEPVSIALDVTGSTFQGLEPAVDVVPTKGLNGVTEARTDLNLRFSHNRYSMNRIDDATVHFKTTDPGPNTYVLNTSVTINDHDGVFPDPAEVDVGPVENGNEYILIPE